MISAAARARRDQRGSGTILIMAVVIFMLLIAAGFGVVGEYVVANHRARAAADLAALAGARDFGAGGDGCGRAAKYAARNGHRLAGCWLIGDPTDFVITTRISAPVPVTVPGVPRRLTVTAYAGPVR